MRCGPADRRFQLLPFRAPLSGTGSATASEPAASRSADPRINRIPRLHSKQNRGEGSMNLMELQRALRQLRLGGTAPVPRTPLHQTLPAASPPPNPLSGLLHDEFGP